MRSFLNKHRSWLFPGSFALIAFGILCIWLGFRQEITIRYGEDLISVRTAAWRVSRVLTQAGIAVDQADRVMPDPETRFWRQSLIAVEPSFDVIIKTPDEDVMLRTVEQIPANLLQEAGIALFPSDQIRLNGQIIDPDTPISKSKTALLQFVPAKQVLLEIDGRAHIIYTSEVTLGAALEAAGIFLAPEDAISEALSTPVTGGMSIAIRRAQPVTVTVGGQTVTGLSAARTVGEALDDLGMALQNLDYSLPPDEASLPADRQIQVIRVNEALMIATEEVPHQSTYQEDPETPLDQASVIQPGQNGIFATRERIRYENGEEIWRVTQPTWQASEPQTAIVGYGSKIVVQSAVVQGETLEYYRKLTVWTTSYKPCIPNTDICYYGTSSGLPVEKGVIAVNLDWYLLMQGQRLYVMDYGYGVIGDVCGGCVGKPWIDLGYSEDNYEALHLPNAWRTIYFLTPVPGYVPVLLP